jgi:hypothetical protein
VRREQLLGAWNLESFTANLPDGSTVYPYGPDALGSLLYSASGRVSAALCKRDRGEFGVQTLEQSAGAAAEARLRAFDSYTSYAGRFELVDDVVEHHVEIALVPSIIGQTLRREARLDGQTLLLSYTIDSDRGPYRNELRWSVA